MKTTKRIASLVLAVLLLATAMMVPAVAADNCTITITNANANHTYTAYQIFYGELGGGVLSNAQWGTGVNSTTLLAALKASTDPLLQNATGNIFAGCDTAREVATALETNVKTVAATDVFARIVAQNLTATGATGTLNGNDYVISNLAAGYYIVVDSGSSVPGEATSKYMIQVSSEDPDVKVAVKADAPTMVKSVARILNTTYTEGISASYGDTVFFKLDGKLHSRLADYGKFYYQVVDTLPAGVTFDKIESVEVVNDTKVDTVADTYYTVDQTGSTLTVTFDDVKAAVLAATGIEPTAEDHVVIKYSVTVNDGDVATPATIGQAGNENKVVLKYSSDPNVPENYATTTGTTAVDTAYIYSYQITIDKIEGTNATVKLADAEFVLYRNISGMQYAVVNADGELTGWATDEAGASKLKTDANGAVSVIGLASGTYFLKETKAPAGGYNLLEDVVSVTVNATANTVTGALETLTATTTHGGQAATDVAAGKVTVTIGNNKGHTLPSTGGMGTTVFYIAGGALVLCAIVVLMMKKRSAEN